MPNIGYGKCLERYRLAGEAILGQEMAS